MRLSRAGPRGALAAAAVWWLAVIWLAVAAPAHAATGPEFPQLTGRVVDTANMLDGATRERLTQVLAAHEKATSNQVVVVTVPDLQGYPIEEYGYLLGRAWGIGQKGRDNGVVLLVAEQERRVRIEVGYGLEGALTDALSANIIHHVITPRFRRGDFDRGLEDGVGAVIAAIEGEYEAIQPRVDTRLVGIGGVVILVVVVLIIVIAIAAGSGGSGTAANWGSIAGGTLGAGLPRRRGRGFGGGGGSGGFGGGGFGGGFGGGGGGFGGGGASGGW